MLLRYDCTKPPVSLEYFVADGQPYAKKNVDAKFMMEITKAVLEAGKSRSRASAETKAKNGHKLEQIKSSTFGLSVRYLKPAELAKMEVTVDKGKLLLEKKPFDTTDGKIFGMNVVKGRYIFVMSEEGKIYAANQIEECEFVNAQKKAAVLEKFKDAETEPEEAPPSSYYGYLDLNPATRPRR